MPNLIRNQENANWNHKMLFIHIRLTQNQKSKSLSVNKDGEQQDLL